MRIPCYLHPLKLKPVLTELTKRHALPYKSESLEVWRRWEACCIVERSGLYLIADYACVRLLPAPGNRGEQVFTANEIRVAAGYEPLGEPLTEDDDEESEQASETSDITSQ